MRAALGLTPEVRIIDVGAPNAALARDLAEQGCARYLALVDPVELDGIRRRAGDLADRIHPLTSPDAVFRNNADLVVVRASHARLAWAWREFAPGCLLAVEHVTHGMGAEGRLAALLAGRVGSLQRRGRLSAGGVALDVLAVPGTRPPATRTYFSEVWGPEGLAERLAGSRLSYSLLRWFDKLPVIDEGEDLDVLVADEDLAAFRELVGREPGTMPMDLYSVSGLPHADYHGLAYYPPPLARGLLERAIGHRNGFQVPSPEDHLNSLTYHVLYHKGLRSGLESELLGRSSDPPEHDYPAVLAALAEPLGISLPSTLEGLDTYLDSVGWRPSRDARRRLGAVNPWVRATEPIATPATTPDGPEIAVFLVREQTLAAIGLDETLKVLDHFGFDVVQVHELDEATRVRTAAAIRGGNWGPGPFPLSGGRPAVVVVAVHHAPEPVPAWLENQYPHLTNMSTYEAKQRLRKVVEERVGTERAFNPIHSADDRAEAWEYLEVAIPDELHVVRAEVRARHEELATAVPVIEQLSRGRRAKVEVVEGADGPVVRKTFARGYRRFLDREVQAMTVLHGAVDAVPPVLDTGSNWFTCPYYRDELAGLLSAPPGEQLVPLDVLRQMVAVLRQVHELGYDLVDAKPQNFVLDPREGLKLVDFEFVYQYRDGLRPPFERSYNFVGTPPGFDGDVPVGDQSYEVLWQPFTGLPLDVLVHGSVRSQQLHRALHRFRQLTIVPGSPAKRPLRAVRWAARRMKATASRRYGAWAHRRARALDIPSGPCAPRSEGRRLTALCAPSQGS